MADIDSFHLDGVTRLPDDFVELYRRQGEWLDQTLSEMLFTTVDRFGAKPAIIDEHGRAVTYLELGDRTLRYVAGFDEMGIGRGDRVVVHLPNIVDYIPIVFALFEIGAIPVLALAALREHEIEYFITFTEAKAYITVDTHSGAKLGELATRLRDSGLVEHTVVISQATGECVPDLLSREPATRRRRCLPTDIAFLQLSGGTTGSPKIIPHTHADYLSAVRPSVKAGSITSDTVQMVVLPMCHSFAMRSPGYLGVLSEGGTVVLATSGSPDVTFPLIAQYRVTDVSVVPPLALAWLNSSLRETHDLTSLEVLRVGGARFSAHAASRVGPELGAKVQQSFGMAEGLTTFTGLDDPLEIATVCQGRPACPSDEVLIVDENDQPVPNGVAGNLLTRGPSTIRGYYRAPETNRTAFTEDGYYRTGDIVKSDDAGNLTVVGRAKDQINRGGEKISPEEIENLLLTHPAIHDVSVIGVPDEVLGERTKAVVVGRENADPNQLRLQSLRQHLRELGLAAYKLPDVVEIVESLERTAVGKVSKRLQRTR